jgi:hypothetical protein
MARNRLAKVTDCRGLDVNVGKCEVEGAGLRECCDFSWRFPAISDPGTAGRWPCRTQGSRTRLAISRYGGLVASAVAIAGISGMPPACHPDPGCAGTGRARAGPEWYQRHRRGVLTRHAGF